MAIRCGLNKVRVTSLLCNLEYFNCYQQLLPVYFSRVFDRHVLFDALTIQSRKFSRKSCVNQVSLYLQRAKLIDSIRLTLRSSSPESLVSVLNDPALDSFVVTNALHSAPSPESAMFLVESLKGIPHFKHTQNSLHALAKILAKSGQVARLKALINGINSGKFINVARVSFMDKMRWFAAAGDLDEVLGVWKEWRAVQNRPCTESYNIVMALCAQMHKDSEAVKTFCRLIDEGGLPNARTYTVIIDHLVNLGKLDKAMQIFQILPSMRIKRTLRQYSVLVGAFTGTRQFDMVKILLDNMHLDAILPGRAMHSSLQCMQEAGYVEETVELIKEMLPDERIKSIKSSATDSDYEDDDDHENEHANSTLSDAGENAVQLRPWFDPAALASALYYWRPEELSTLEDANFVWTTRLVSKMIRNFRSAETAWQFFSWVSYQPGFCHNVYTISRMITKLARDGKVNLVDQLLFKIKREGIKLSFSTVKLIIDFYGVSGNGEPALKVLQGAKTLCGPLSNNSLLLLYSSLLRALSKCKMHDKALDILDEMILSGLLPDIQTFSGLMHHFALQGEIKTVQRLFGMVKQSEMKPDAYMFKILITAYCKSERSALALRVFEDMRNANMMLDTSTKDFLVNSLWKEGKLREAASVEENSQEISDVLPLALPGHLFTVSSTDLSTVYEIYSDSLKPTC